MHYNKEWFILNSGDVSGPWSQQEAEAYLISQRQSQIWKKGQNEWMSSEAWLKKYYFSDQTTLEKDENTTLYNLKDDHKQLTKVSLSTLVDYLKNQENLNNVYICRDGETIWKEAYTFSEITESLGISRRKSPRMPLLGTLSLHTPQVKKFPAVVIGEGGLGITLAQELTIGEIYEGLVESSSLNLPLSVQVEVVFVAPNG